VVLMFDFKSALHRYTGKGMWPIKLLRVLDVPVMQTSNRLV
jgi:hypothetical protein